MESNAPSAPKPSLKAWLTTLSFTQKVKKDAEWRPVDDGPVFGVTLQESLNHASVKIHLISAAGALYTWGVVPIVVAKCGQYLKANATEVPGTFRVSGSSKRTRDLQAIFERSPDYGRSLKWSLETYTTNDIATVFRRYLTHMPEPVIPHDLYHSFRDALARPNYDKDEIVVIYKRLIAQMPRSNQHLLLYVLDLLSVFAQKSDKNLMPSSNLAVIFRPGLISHPQHELSTKEFELSQKVLEFLIDHQDQFTLEMPTPPKGSIKPSPLRKEDMEMVTISSEEESSSVGPDGWKLVKNARPAAPRRRTTMSSNDDRGIKNDGSTPPNSSPDRPNLRDGMKRSRTLPLRKKGLIDGDEPPRVLRKQKRVSAAQPSAPREGG